jgi:hypothetical protein
MQSMLQKQIQLVFDVSPEKLAKFPEGADKQVQIKMISQIVAHARKLLVSSGGLDF